MKKTFLVVMVFVGVFTCGAVVGGALTFRFRDSFVEGRGAGKFMTEQRRDLAERLGLTAEQKKKIQPIISRFSEDQQATRKQMQVSFDRMRDDLEAILTPEQRKTYKDYRAQQWERERERRSKREGDNRGGPGDSKAPAQSGPHKQLRERERRSEKPAVGGKVETQMEVPEESAAPSPTPAPGATP